MSSAPSSRISGRLTARPFTRPVERPSRRISRLRVSVPESSSSSSRLRISSTRCGKRGGELKRGFHAGAGGSAADAGGIRLAADDRLDGIQDDRFARAGLAGEDVQAGVEPQLELLDDGEVFDPQALQHGLFFTELETGNAVISGGRGSKKIDALHDQRVEIYVESKEVIEEIDNRR